MKLRIQTSNGDYYTGEVIDEKMSYYIIQSTYGIYETEKRQKFKVYKAHIVSEEVIE